MLIVVATVAVSRRCRLLFAVVAGVAGCGLVLLMVSLLFLVGAHVAVDGCSLLLCIDSSCALL